MFDDFALDRIDLGDVVVRVRHGGSGPPVLLLHGHPRTHTTWHRVAPLLGRDFTIVCPDLRGYGESSKPPDEPDHAQASKRVMARDAIGLMRALGHERFAIVGHDRGAYAALRTALDHPAAVTHLAILDAIPIGEALARTNARFAQSWPHWFFFGLPEKPEHAILCDPDAWYRSDAEVMGRENYEDYRRAIHDPAAVHAMVEDYRAGLGVDRAADEAVMPRDGRSRLRCSSCGRHATISAPCTVTRARFGGRGRMTCRVKNWSRATTWRRRSRTCWPLRSDSSWPLDPSSERRNESSLAA